LERAGISSASPARLSAAGPAPGDRGAEVLRLVAAGMTTKQIASALFIAEGTVKTHLNAVHTRRGGRDRTKAVMVAIRRVILEP
jgi:DNA-binding NarL/FixJ family response regulator